MKKILSILLMFSILFCSIVYGDDKYILSNKDFQNIKRVYSMLKFETKTEYYKKSLLKSLETTLSKLEEGTKNYEIILALIDEIKANEGAVNSEIITNTTPQTEDNSNNTEQNTSEINQNNKEQVVVGGGFDEISYRVDLTKAREQWMGWQNEVRVPMGLRQYEYSKKLESSANDWSKILLDRGDLDVMSVHKRDLSDSYYDYNKISGWMKDRGVVCKNVGRYTFSESVAFSGYSCSEKSEDCTQEFIEGMRKSFDRYMSERERTEDSRPHYNSIISPNFKIQGMGIEIRPKGNSYFEVFITTHYCTELE